jgi:hypothetical protein
VRLRPVLAFVLLVSLPAACTGDSGTEGGGDAGAASGSGGAVPTAVGSPLVEPDVAATLELLAPPTEGAGEVPTFSWAAVSGASTYRLVVLDGDRGPIWAWEGAETSVNLGGLPNERPAGEPGPVIGPGSSWSVTALDDEGHVVAVSPSRPVSP